MKLVSEFKNMPNPPELVLALWKVLANLWDEPTDNQNLFKIVKNRDLIKRLLDFDIKNVT